MNVTELIQQELRSKSVSEPIISKIVEIIELNEVLKQDLGTLINGLHGIMSLLGGTNSTPNMMELVSILSSKKKMEEIHKSLEPVNLLYAKYTVTKEIDV